ncbi:MAG: PilZ domain-containing protein [Phycisphaerae bacterium]
MDAEQIVKMTPNAIRELIEARKPQDAPDARGVRKADRWPFAGTVEVWLPDDSYGERHVLATLHNLSENGLAMRCRRPIATSTRISLALHQPELSCYVHAVVRHCTRANVGYLVGVEFLFEGEEEK